MRLTPERIERLEKALDLRSHVPGLRVIGDGDLEDLLADLVDLHATVARLEQRLQDAEGDARRFCGLAGAAMRGERVKG